MSSAKISQLRGHKWFLSGATLVVGMASASASQKIEIPDWENAVVFDVVLSQDKLRPGDKAELAVMATIQPGYHLYGPEEPEPSRTKVSVSGAGARLGEVRYPEVIRRDLSGLGEFDLYEGEVAIRIPVENESTESGELALEVTVDFQICTDFACSAPDSEDLSVPVAVAPAGSAVKSLHPTIFTK